MLKLHVVSYLGSLKIVKIALNCGEGNGTPLQYSCLENPMDGGAWKAEVHGVARSRTQLSNFTFPFHFHALEKEMATHSSVLAWRIPGTGEAGGLPSLGSHRVGHDWSDLAAAAALNWDVAYSWQLASMAPLPWFVEGQRVHPWRWLTCAMNHTENELKSIIKGWGLCTGSSS